MKKMIALVLLFALMFSLSACGGKAKTDNKVVIYSCVEDFREEYYLKRIKEEFPDYDIVMEYVPTGNLAAKIKAEGGESEGDILLSLDTTYMEGLQDSLADLSSYDYSHYLDELVPQNKKYMVWERWSGCIVMNTELLAEKGLQAPTSYQDLLKPEYKGLISMPNPKSSGTGYFFLYNLVQNMGEEEAFAYFDSLAPQVLQFTSSGSGPINALLQNEAAIGFGMTFQAITERNKGAQFDIVFFEEGAPYGTAGTAMVVGKDKDPAVKAVYDFLMTTLVKEDKEKFSPELIFKDQVITVQDYPDVPYADMTGYFNEAEKTRLLEKWKY